MDLVIVESPAKAKTIEKYLGSGYKVIASVGHIIDLPTGELGVDIENGFKPSYTVIEGKQKVIDSLKETAKTADTVYLAPDPDREGEAIAWHIAEQIKGENKPIKRVLFNEITKKGIMDGISNPGEINKNRVNAQQSRRILDRLVGYMVSPLLWRPLKSGLSAGRVQSVALRLVCEREREIETFVPVESWSVEADFEIKGKTDGESGLLKARLDKIGGKKAELKTEADADRVLNNLPSSYSAASVEKKEVKQSPPFPFITSRMQQEAIRRFGFTAKKVMTVAQQLYEGVELGSEGPMGLITYMRTDSVRISPEAEAECAAYVEKIYGKEYLPAKKRVRKKAQANVQDAHEAIRPTSVGRVPKDIKQFLTPDQYKLYKLIWERFVASQMADAVYDQTTVQIEGGELVFKASARVMKFAGFSALYTESGEEKQDEDTDAPIPFDIVQGSSAELKKIDKKQHFTQSPPRFTEASLVKTLEQQGIGRPSTYASIISTIVDRKYVELTEKKFKPTELGRIVNNLLTTNFPKIFEVKFTAEMEKDLDLIEEGKENWTDVLSAFYKDFDKELKTASSGKLASDLQTGKKCPSCGEGDLTIKCGKNGPFLACTKYPGCSFTSGFKREENGDITLLEEKPLEGMGVKCEKCGRELVIKRSRYGEMAACPGYPECKNIKNFIRCPDGTVKIIEPGEKINKECPKCGSDLVVKSGKNGIFAACVKYPDCKFTATVSVNQDGTLGAAEGKTGSSEAVCEKCGKPMVIKRGPRSPFLACSGYPDCKNTKALKPPLKRRNKN